MPTQGSMGTRALLGLDTTNPIAKGFEFKVFGLTAKPQALETGGSRGTRSHAAETVAAGLIPIDGTFTINPTPSQLANLLQFILGGSPTGSSPTTYPLGETLPGTWYATIDRIAKVHTYSGVKVNKATFSSSEGGELELALDLVALTQTVANAGTFPAAVALPIDQPFTHQNATFTWDAVLRNVKDVQVVIDNKLIARFLNSQTAQSYVEGDRTVGVNATTPFTADEVDLYTQLCTVQTSGTCVWVSGAKTLTMTFAALQSPTKDPEVTAFQEIPLKLEYMARTTGSNLLSSIVRELVTTL